VKFDEIGYWWEIKLDIVKDYASAYSRILAAQKKLRLHHVYIDAFAGAGVHISKTTREHISGSPINALLVQPPFREYHLIDIDRQKVELLRELVKNRSDVRFNGYSLGNCWRRIGLGRTTDEYRMGSRNLSGVSEARRSIFLQTVGRSPQRPDRSLTPWKNLRRDASQSGGMRFTPWAVRSF